MRVTSIGFPSSKVRMTIIRSYWEFYLMDGGVGGSNVFGEGQWWQEWLDDGQMSRSRQDLEVAHGQNLGGPESSRSLSGCIPSRILDGGRGQVNQDQGTCMSALLATHS